MFKTRLLSWNRTCCGGASYYYQRRVCTVFYPAWNLTDWNAGTVPNGNESTAQTSLMDWKLQDMWEHVIYYALMVLDFEKYGMMGVILAFMIFMFVYVFTYPKYTAEQVMPAFFGVVYVAVMLSFIYLTRNLPDGKFLVWLIFLCSWGCDTCAYCVGVLIGKHKMAPKLSPKKSIEGAVGGVVGAAF